MKNKSVKNILLIVMGVLIVVAVIARILKIQTKPVPTVLYLISLLFTALYGFWFYKKPHGNMLKYAMLIFAVTTIIQGCYSMASDGTVTYALVRVLAAAAVCYCAGRMDRIKENRYLMPVIALLFLMTSIYKEVCDVSSRSVELASSIRHFSYTINFITLMLAYFIRYKEHREAGLTDSQKK